MTDKKNNDLKNALIMSKLLMFCGLGMLFYSFYVAVTSEFYTYFWLTFGLALALLFGGGRLKHNANNVFKDSYVATALRQAFDVTRYDPKHCPWTNAKLDELKCFSSFDSCSGSDYLEAAYQGKPFTRCDLTLQNTIEYSDTDSDGNSTTRSDTYTLFQGCVLTFTFTKSFESEVRVESKSFNYAEAPGEWHMVDTELEDFNQRFYVRSKDPVQALKILTPQMLLGIFDIRKVIDAPLLAIFKENTLLVFINSGRDAFDLSGTASMDREIILLQQDIRLITDFMDTMYFKKGTIAMKETEESAEEAGQDKAS